VKHRQWVQRWWGWWEYPYPWLRFEPYSIDNPNTWILRYESTGSTYNPDIYYNGDVVWGENIVIYYKTYYDNTKTVSAGPDISIIK